MSRLPEWVGMLLRFASFANIVWGLTLSLVAEGLLRWAQIEVPTTLFPWRMLGMLAIIFGLAYYFISFNPVKGILVLALGTLIKLVETITVVAEWISGLITYQMVLYFAAKDFLWLGPLISILYLVFREWQSPADAMAVNPDKPLSQTLSQFTTNRGTDLNTLSYQQPVLLIFLRHFGCAFCREALQEIADRRSSIEAQGVKIVLIHMGSHKQGEFMLQKNRFTQAEHVSDPDCILYSLFRLRRARFSQILGIWSGIRGLKAGILNGYGLGQLIGDGFRMPGAFLVYRGETLKSYKYQFVSDRPDYVALATWQV
uniref:Redoxin domain-containing protein n=1 Tax=Roseihalotalea indica TaxID=2867963 RepID=A0AA49JHW7_9BACT|nr:redoxin domain-containing protein [Tunicatimonas sp. TK19036]